jgi:RNA ligase
VATRGSFASEQAAHATRLLAARYAEFTPPAGITVLVEILYPANRIVVNYGDTDDLHLLGAVDIATGAVLAPDEVPGWAGPVTATFAAPTFADALALPPRPNAEGVVVRCLRTGAMVKIKQADYVALHRIVTGLTARTVWQHLVDGAPLDDLIEPLPDEFHDWVRAVARSITAAVEADDQRLRADFAAVCARLGDGWQRRDFALAVAAHPQRWAMFQLLDDRDLTPELLKRARPEADWTPSGMARDEDTA